MRRYRVGCEDRASADPAAKAEALAACESRTGDEYKSCVNDRWNASLERSHLGWRPLITGLPQAPADQPPGPLHALWVRASNDVRVTGVDGWLLQWNGESRRVAYTPDRPLVLHYVGGAGADDAWAVGQLGTTLHWDGSTWTAVPTGTQQRMRVVRGLGPGRLRLAGEEAVVLQRKLAPWTALPATA